MSKITKQELLGALEPAAVVVIGGPLIQAIPIVGGLFGKLPVWAIGPTAIALPSIVAGAAAILIYQLAKAKLT